jgi:hypothetical protein
MGMARQFEVKLRGRALAVCVRPIDNAWELWVYENGRELILGDVVSIDDVTLQRRDGAEDPVADVVQSIRRRLESGELMLPEKRDERGLAAGMTHRS